MIKCICIDNTGRPPQIPISSWPELDHEYHLTHIYKMALQGNILGCSIYEIPLDESCAPYEMFKMSRFAFNINDLQKIKELASLCEELDGLDIDELIEEQLEVV